MSPPWMPLYIADYRADTAHLGAAEHGAYLLLIMHYWQTGGLPDNDGQLARIACMTPAEWRRARPVVRAFFGDGWTHKRIDEELAHADQVISKRRAAAHAKHSKRGAHAHAYADANAPPDAGAHDGAHGGDTRVSPSQPPSPSQDSSSSLRSDEARGRADPELFAMPPIRGMNGGERMGFDGGAFERFWSRYPHKIGKQAAAKAFVVVKRGGQVEFDRLMAGLERYIRSKPPDRSWCNPATWLNQGRWDDEPDHDAGAGGPRPVRSQPRGGDAVLAGMGHLAARLLGGGEGAADDPGFGEPDA